MSGPAYTNTVRIGYARVSARTQDHQLQLDALDAAGCREVIVETASTRGQRPKLRVTLGRLKPGDTLVIYKPDRIARSMKELLVLLEDELHAREVNLHILTGIGCTGPTGRPSPTRCSSWSPRWPPRWNATSLAPISGKGVDRKISSPRAFGPRAQPSAGLGPATAARTSRASGTVVINTTIPP